MAILTVSSLEDDGGAGTLRAVLAQANATAASDTIVFARGLEGGTLTLARGQLEIASDVTIDGDRDGDGREVQVSGNDGSRVINIGGSGTDARLVDLTVIDGSTYGAPDGQQEGGGIRVGAGQALSLSGVTVTGNGTASYSPGGGIFAGEGAKLTVTGSTISGNGADSGGGIFLSRGSSARIDTSRIANNGVDDASPTSQNSGGGVQLVGASLVLTRSTVDGNRADYGAGIRAVDSQLTIDNATIAENSALSVFGGSGGGLSLSGGYAFIANGTISNNRIGRYGTDDRETSAGIDVAGGAVLSLANTIVAGNYQGERYTNDTPSDIRGTIAYSNGHNIFGSDVAGNVAGDREAFGAVLRISDNGGPTPTAANRGLDENGGADPAAAAGVDQRGFDRPVPSESNPDIGAFESALSVSRAPSASNDVLVGSASADTLDGLAGNDLVLGRGGNDSLRGGAGGDTLNGGQGGDGLEGAAGVDTASYRDAPGRVAASLATGAATGAAGSDSLSGLENLEGGGFADVLAGSSVRNWLAGLDGDDRLFGLGGDDVLRGGAGADRLVGGAGRDRLETGAGADLVEYDSLAQSPAAADRAACDTITDFDTTADRIDLATIDARAATTATNDSFAFLADRGAAFTAAGQVRWLQADGGTFVEASTDGDAAAELQVRLTGLVPIGRDDFIL